MVGGAGAIGTAISHRLLSNGRQVVILDRSASMGHEFPFVHADVTSAPSLDAALENVSITFGVPDALIFAAGYLRGAPIVDLTASDIQDHFNVNLFGAFAAAQWAARQMMADGGRILFISSIHGQIGVPNRGAYAMSKAALGALARAMAVELSPFNIRVNVLAPGAVNVGMRPDPDAGRYWTSETPAGRIADVDEVARFADILTSEQASFLTGQTIALDGGASNLRPFGLVEDL